MATKPSTISLTQFSSAVSQAVKVALQRNPAKSTAPFILNPGVLAGPIIDVATDLKVAQQIADDVTNAVQASQGGAAAAGTAQTLTSAVLITHNHIICGFYPAPPWELNIDTKQ
jgi:hypothetical protein